MLSVTLVKLGSMEKEKLVPDLSSNFVLKRRYSDRETYAECDTCLYPYQL